MSGEGENGAGEGRSRSGKSGGVGQRETVVVCAHSLVRACFCNDNRFSFVHKVHAGTPQDPRWRAYAAQRPTLPQHKRHRDSDLHVARRQRRGRGRSGAACACPVLPSPSDAAPPTRGPHRTPHAPPHRPALPQCERRLHRPACPRMPARPPYSLSTPGTPHAHTYVCPRTLASSR